jgi:hypothetical protein
MLHKLFQNPTILDNKQHKELKKAPIGNYAFSKEIAYAPIGLQEFWEASKTLFIVFAGNQKEVAPVVLLGDTQNRLLNKANNWKTPYYIPQVFRAYPFGVTITNDNQKLIVIDPKAECFKEEGKALFEESIPSSATKKIIDFTSFTYHQLEQSKKLTQILVELKLLSLAEISMHTPKESFKLGSFYVVDEKKLNQLNSKQFKQLASAGYLNAIYMHLNSLKNQYDLA